MSMLKKIRKFIQATGFDVRRHNILNSFSLHQSALLKALKVNLVVDVGANSGQYGLELRESGYAGDLLSIEPLAGPHAGLCQRSESDQNWMVYKRCAVGNYEGEVKVNVSVNSVSSSILPILDAHVHAESDSQYIGQELAKIYRLDTILSEMHLLDKQIFLKIDTQGYEFDVLAGSAITLLNTKGIVIELSLQELYEGQKDWLEVVAYLRDKGFALWGLHPVFGDLSGGRLLQVDGIFVRD